MLERFLKVRDQRRTLGLSQGHKHDRHGLIVSVNGCKSDSSLSFLSILEMGPNDASSSARDARQSTPEHVQRR